MVKPIIITKVLGCVIAALLVVGILQNMTVTKQLLYHQYHQYHHLSYGGVDDVEDWMHQHTFAFGTSNSSHSTTWTSAEENNTNNNNNDRTVAIFYNFYVPKAPVNADRALSILNEQIKQLGNSFLVRQQEMENYKVVLYYNTIGDPRNDVHTKMTTLCQEASIFACQHMEHYPDGTFEQVTLKAMLDFCQERPKETSSLSSSLSDEHYDTPVLYFHNKGSLNNNNFQALWRKNMMAAITGPDCTTAMSSSKGHKKIVIQQHQHQHQCNLCGQQFLPIWQMIIAGNFFTSKCSYVRQLYDPVQYKEKLTDIGMSVPSLGFSMEVFMPMMCDFLGVGRYTSEQWASSHPNVAPCDLSGNDPRYFPNISNRTFWRLAKSGLGDLLGAAPRFEYSAGWGRKKEVPDLDSASKSDFSLLPGVLYKHLQLYQQVPPASSWIWKWFPGGQLWQETIQNATRKTAGEKLSQTQTMAAIDALLATVQSIPKRATFNGTKFIHLYNIGGCN
eukprot:scaffold9857_cov195-Amphora_coffeaeformis.AAC.4